MVALQADLTDQPEYMMWFRKRGSVIFIENSFCRDKGADFVYRSQPLMYYVLCIMYDV